MSQPGTHHPTRRRWLATGGAASLALATGAWGSGGQSARAADAKPAHSALGKAMAFASSRQPLRTLGGGLTVSAVGLGCQELGMPMYGKTGERAAMVRLARQAFDAGVVHFDTAEAYGPFESERVLGEALAPVRGQVVITSKFGWDIDQATGQRTGKLNSRPAHIRTVVDGMLQRLQTDYIDLLIQHRVDPDVPIEDVAGTMRDLMRQGKLRHWGLCEPGLQTLRRAHREQPLAVVQNEYNLFHRGVEADILPLCEELGIGFVCWSPLAMGMLGGYEDGRRVFKTDGSDFRALVPRYQPDAMRHNIALIELVRRWARQKHCTPAQFSLAWLLAQKPWIAVIPGTINPAHLLENMGAAYIDLSAAELAQLRQELQAITIEGERLPAAVLKFSGAEAKPR